ncbi:MAG: hypothetical protein O2816_16890 [Planctomycetota bacterium]|nr:hypothetical protein [Planctomycetota bacterium]
MGRDLALGVAHRHQDRREGRGGGSDELEEDAYAARGIGPEVGELHEGLDLGLERYLDLGRAQVQAGMARADLRRADGHARDAELARAGVHQSGQRHGDFEQLLASSGVAPSTHLDRPLTG